ncbi:hypothetical protein [Bacillus pumilus]|uniref:hypothetical protein n=1 Tax=Bacillus pumilus TaxID=1408 RepID=UPI0020A06A36|nr:hypothetical protein [Bacillus pumilus]MCP1528583.1 hypothetical protein [Bacillus pumilus]MDF9783963.1 hypothetical protein [Bacillus pumilus]MED1527882.1 hypothetical protein [Bacillus pumilus]
MSKKMIFEILEELVIHVGVAVLKNDDFMSFMLEILFIASIKLISWYLKNKFLSDSAT